MKALRPLHHRMLCTVVLIGVGAALTQLRLGWSWRPIGSALVGVIAALFAAGAGGLICLFAQGCYGLSNGHKEAPKLAGGSLFILSIMGWIGYQAATGPLVAIMQGQLTPFAAWCAVLCVSGIFSMGRWRFHGGLLVDSGQTLSPVDDGRWVKYSQATLTLLTHTPTLFAIVCLYETPETCGASPILACAGLCGHFTLIRYLNHQRRRTPMQLQVQRNPRALRLSDSEGAVILASEVHAVQHHRWQHVDQPIERRPTYVRVDLLLRNGGFIELFGGDQDRVVQSYARARHIAKGLRVQLIDGQGARDWPRQWQPNEDPPAVAPRQGTRTKALLVQAQQDQLTLTHRPTLTASGAQDLNITPWVNASLLAAMMAAIVQAWRVWSFASPADEVGILATIAAVVWLWLSSRRRQRIRMSPQHWQIDACRIVGHRPSRRHELERQSVQWVRVEARLKERYAALKIGGHGQSMHLIEVFSDQVETTLGDVLEARARLAAFWGLP